MIPQSISLDADSVIDEAIAITGLDNFGAWDFREAMGRLLSSLDTEAKLNVDGRVMHRQKVVDILCTRLHLESLVAKYPEIIDEEIENPIVIVGLPRTGSTVLLRMLAVDQRFYSNAYWETRYPVPLPTHDFSGLNDPRIAMVKAEVQSMLETVPDIIAMHPLDAMAADEEIGLLEQCFFSTNPEAYANVPTYGGWLANQDQTQAYEYLKRLLQCLQWQKKRRGIVSDRWVLKTPHHVHWMDVLLKVFPDVQIIQTHRDPLETMPSIASLIYSLWKLSTDDADAEAVGQQWNSKWASGLARCMKVREVQPANRFLDIQFADTVKRPIETLKAIYSFVGMELTGSVRSAVDKWRQENSRDKRPPHKYSLSKFGLSEEQIKRDYAGYRQLYINMSK